MLEKFNINIQNNEIVLLSTMKIIENVFNLKL